MTNRDGSNYALELFKMAAGIFLLIVCAQFVLDSALFFAGFFNIAGSLIGALIIGVATALPEFTTAVTALLRGSSGLSLGTLVGSNITNPLFGIGIGAAIATYQVDADIVWLYIPFWFAASVLGMFFFYRKLSLQRYEALILMLLYPAFVIFRLFLEVAG